MNAHTCGAGRILHEVDPFESDDPCNARPEAGVSGRFEGLESTHKLPHVISAMTWILSRVDTRSSGCVSSPKYERGT